MYLLLHKRYDLYRRAKVLFRCCSVGIAEGVESASYDTMSY